jgi:hypothetical protein
MFKRMDRRLSLGDLRLKCSGQLSSSDLLSKLKYLIDFCINLG